VPMLRCSATDKHADDGEDDEDDDGSDEEGEGGGAHPFIFRNSFGPGLAVQVSTLPVVPRLTLAPSFHCVSIEPATILIPVEILVFIALDFSSQPLAVVSSPAQQAVISPPLVPLVVGPAKICVVVPHSKLGPQFLVLIRSQISPSLCHVFPQSSLIAPEPSEPSEPSITSIPSVASVVPVFVSVPPPATRSKFSPLKSLGSSELASLTF